MLTTRTMYGSSGNGNRTSSAIGSGFSDDDFSKNFVALQKLRAAKLTGILETIDFAFCFLDGIKADAVGRADSPEVIAGVKRVSAAIDELLDDAHALAAQLHAANHPSPNDDWDSSCLYHG